MGAQRTPNPVKIALIFRGWNVALQLQKFNHVLIFQNHIYSGLEQYQGII